MQLNLWILSLSSRTTRDTHLCIGPVTMVTTEIHNALLHTDDKVIFHGYILSEQMGLSLGLRVTSVPLSSFVLSRS